ncbi:glycosyltransferase family 2 protein [Candidatus Roizmanbacteria bacterium]|nr:glycosyltransferase family 2 protein [Candidatus Roizmanbacteria bacterium]
MKKKSSLLYSIIITCFNGEKYLNKCLDALLAYRHPHSEIIFIDDGSTDRTAAMAKKYKVEIKTSKYKVNRGASSARNYAAKKARGKYLIFLDVDCEVKKYSLSRLIQTLERHQKIGMTQAVLLKPNGATESTGHFLSFFGLPYNIKITAKGKLLTVFGTRTALAVRAKLFHKIGGYDEDYIIYGEDTDLAWRTWLSGAQVVTVLNSFIYHHHYSSLSKKTRHRLYYEGCKNQLVNILKNEDGRYLIWMIPLYIFSWFIIAVKLIVQGKANFILWIVRAFSWNIVNLPSTLKKRKIISSYKAANNKAADIQFGSLTLNQALENGFQWLLSF